MGHCPVPAGDSRDLCSSGGRREKPQILPMGIQGLPIPHAASQPHPHRAGAPCRGTAEENVHGGSACVRVPSLAVSFYLPEGVRSMP